MAEVQESGNWVLALVSGQTTTLLDLSSEENNTLIGCSGVYREAAHLSSSHGPRRSDWVSIWLDGPCLRCFLLEKLRVKLSVGSVSWPLSSVIPITKHPRIYRLHCVNKSFLSSCLSHTCSSHLITILIKPWEEGYILTDHLTGEKSRLFVCCTHNVCLRIHVRGESQEPKSRWWVLKCTYRCGQGLPHAVVPQCPEASPSTGQDCSWRSNSLLTTEGEQTPPWKALWAS